MMAATTPPAFPLPASEEAGVIPAVDPDPGAGPTAGGGAGVGTGGTYGASAGWAEHELIAEVEQSINQITKVYWLKCKRESTAHEPKQFT